LNFNQIIDRLAKAQRVQRLGGYALIYVLLVVLYVVLFYMPKGDELDSARAEQDKLLKDKADIEKLIANRAETEVELQSLQAKLAQALKELPEDREIPGLLKGISSLGKKVGLEVKKFQPLLEVKREYVAEVPVALEVEGSFHEVALFFDRLSKMNRIVYVQDVEMVQPDERGGKVYLQVSGNVVTFRFLTDEEIAAQQAAGKGKGKKGGGAKAPPAPAGEGE
jgi:type IV pilus assembly protein PilO